MSAVDAHYATHLGPIYLWMAGGLDAALAQGADDIAPLLPPPCSGAVAVDLGAGFGMHALPLARAGYRVVAVDASSLLLAHLREQAGGLDMDVVQDDLLAWLRRSRERPDLVVCMGDTLPHLPDLDAVAELLRRVCATLRPGGRFVATFRDHTRVAVGTQRFIPVRSDDQRILTCFLEQQRDRVLVHDILQERQPDGWSLRVSAYPKLRLAPAWVQEQLQGQGLHATQRPGPRGMLWIEGVRADGTS